METCHKLERINDNLDYWGVPYYESCEGKSSVSLEKISSLKNVNVYDVNFQNSTM